MGLCHFLIILFLVYSLTFIRFQMSNIAKKSQVKANNFTQKSSNLVCKQPIIRENGIKNKINLPNYQEEKDKFFDANPMIVTRRNISTAQAKKQHYQDDEQDLIFTTSTCLKKKQQPKYTSHFSQTVKESFKKGSDRPQSKQQPRSKGWNNAQLLIKSTVAMNDRPQTSKGQRPKQLYKSKVQQSTKRKISLGNQQQKNTNDCETGAMVSNNSSASKNSKLFFKTSIDSEFLSLFAN